MMTTRKSWIIVAGLVLVGAMTACAGSDGMMDKKMKGEMHGEMAAGTNDVLMGSDGHHASGKVSLAMEMNKHVLTLDDIKVDKVPDGYVYLTKGADRMHGVELGMLKQFSGTVSYVLPEGVNPDDFDSVVIWCKQFNVEIGRAFLSKKMM